MAAEETEALTGLVVPVPAAARVVGDGVRVPAHVTLLAPFLPRPELTDGLLGELRALFADVVPFSFELDEVCVFPSGTVYLAPRPPGPFRQLTLELTRRFPEHPPYGGQFPELVPHLTVPLRDGESVADVERRLREHGPVQGLATEAHLLRVTDDDVEVVAVFPFGTAAA
jgi:hypothetical protein